MGVRLRPRKILYVTAGLRMGGAEAMLARLVTAQPRVAADITVVSLLPAEGFADELRGAGVTLVELDFSRPVGIAAGLRTLSKLIATTQPDIVQGWMYHGDLAALFALVMSGRRRSTQLVWSIRCSEVDLSRYGLGLRLAVKAGVALSRLPDVVTANSAAGLQSHVKLGYRPRRAEVIVNGIDIDRFKPDPAARAAVRAELGVPAEAFLVAHVARVDPMKDHATFLTAMKELPDLRALLIGAGTECLPAPTNALALGRRSDVERMFAAADLVVSSSAFGEGFSNVLAEGMASGLPAVATDVGDARAIVGDSGLIVPPGDPRALADAIRVLATEPAAERAKRGARARDRIVEHYAMRVVVDRFADFYRSLVDTSG